MSFSAPLQFIFLDRVSPQSWRLELALWVRVASQQTQDPPVSAPPVLELQACAATSYFNGSTEKPNSCPQAFMAKYCTLTRCPPLLKTCVT